MPNISPVPAASLLEPANHLLILIDHESQMAFATRSQDPVTLRNNVGLLAHAARAFGVDTLLTTVDEDSFSGPLFPEITEAFPGVPAVDRTTMNPWEDPRIVERVRAAGKTKIVVAGLWTSVCVAMPVLCALEQGLEVYVVVDACGDVSAEAHDWSMRRMVQAGARPLTALQYLLELQRDWARGATLEETGRVATRFGGAYGLGQAYAAAMLRPQQAEGMGQVERSAAQAAEGMGQVERSAAQAAE